MTEPQLDPRWEWIESPTFGGPSEYIRGACRHLTPVEVRATVTDEVVAHLCPDCDHQLPAEWQPTRR
ncbi:hypothetical protein KBY55_09535 [Streptomyces sp. b94]|uniref:hypothetical protein n=1 Tax=Streptomyces sp. b94 TaxID=1827634 RepID=UPI001B388C24|nr:hypothetical protein [Streptomyces sp. b94]MBQ1096325.1 hypothetical protein [Streptomyces sp. b94]